MKAKELREMAEEDLKAKIEDQSKELFQLKFQLHTGHLEDPAKLRKVRRNIARAKTILHQKQAAKQD